MVETRTGKFGIEKTEERREKERRRKETRREGIEEEKRRRKKKKLKKKRIMEVKKIAEKWEIWDKEGKAAKSEEEAKKLVPEWFY